jgi:hypothetical protein
MAVTTNVGTFAESDEVKVYTASVTLTNTQIKALPTTGIQLVAAQGAGTILRVSSVLLYATLTTPYTNHDTNGGSISIQYSGGAAASNPLVNDSTDGFSSMTDLLGVSGASAQLGMQQSPSPTQGANSYYTLVSGGATPIDIRNQGLMIKADNIADGDFTGGHADNELFVELNYFVTTLS